MLDELLRHLVAEMAMDGEEGCSVERIDGFIEAYYNRRKVSHPFEPVQLIDVSYKNFVWKSLCRLDQVRLGVLQRDSNQTEYSNLCSTKQRTATLEDEGKKTLELPLVASNASNKMTQRKTRPSRIANRRDRNITTNMTDNAQPSLSIGQQRVLETGQAHKNLLAPEPTEKNLTKRNKKQSKPTAVLPVCDWKELGADSVQLSRDELITKFGVDEDGQSRLRVAVDPMTCWRAVVGTDARSPKMTAYVYQVLCIVAQGREEGATVIELGQKLKHDQKSLFHFVKVLTDFQLVVKFRAYQHKAWTNRVVHRRYLATSEWYKTSVKKDENLPAASTSQIASTSRRSDRDYQETTWNHSFNEQTMMDVIDTNDSIDQRFPPMSPITKEHIAVNEALIKHRIFTVLDRSPNHAMIHADIIKAIGLTAPTKDDRRRLNRHIDIYIKRGLLEKVVVVNVSGHTPCLRLTEDGETCLKNMVSTSRPSENLPSDEEPDEELCVLPLTRSIGQRIYELLTASGPEGMAYKDLCHQLNGIEIRTTEQILTRMEREQPPPHLSDIKVASVMETSGREKRVRWFSALGLKQRCEAADIPLPSSLRSENQLTKAGGFMPINPCTLHTTFYKDARELYGIAAPEPKGNWGRRPCPSPKITLIGRPRKFPRGITCAERRELRKKELQGLDIFDDTMALFKKYEHIPGNQFPLLVGLNPQASQEESGAAETSRVTTVSETERIFTRPKQTKRSRSQYENSPGDTANDHCAKRTSQESSVLPPDQPAGSQADLESLNEPQSTVISPELMSLPPDEKCNQSEPSPDLTTPGLSNALRVRHNLSTMQRECHLLEAIKYVGGIIEKNHELAKVARDLNDRYEQGQTGCLMDTRTFNVTLYALERRGEIKETTVLITDALGHSRSRKIIYLSSFSLDSPEMIAWLKDFRARFTIGVQRVAEPAPENSEGSTRRSTSKNQLLGPLTVHMDDGTLRSAFLNQWRCVAQYYGFIMGKVARARILHLHLLKSLSCSGSLRIFSSYFLCQELPISLYACLIPISLQSQEYEEFRNTPGALDTRMDKVPLTIRRLFQIGHQFARMKVYQILEILCRLKVVIPLQRTTEVTEYCKVGDNGVISYYAPTPMGLMVGMFCLADEGKVHKYCEKPASEYPLLAKWPLKNESHGEKFWNELKRASIPDPEQPPTAQQIDSNDPDRIFRGSANLLLALLNQTKWQDKIELTPSQRDYLIQLDANTNPPIDLEKDHDKISRLAHVLVTVPEAIKQGIRNARQAIDQAKDKTFRLTKQTARRSRPRKKQKLDVIDAEKLRIAQEEAAKVLYDKAQNLLRQRENDWNSIINRFKAQSGVTEIDVDVLKDLHVLFITPQRGINAIQLENELNSWLNRKTKDNTITWSENNEIDSLALIKHRAASRSMGTLPLLPSVKAKYLKMLSEAPPRKLKPTPRPRVLPEKPRRSCALASRAIRPQSNVNTGARPVPLIAPADGKRARLEWDDKLDEFLRDMVAIVKTRAYATSANVDPWPIVRKVFRGYKTHQLKHRYYKLARDRKEKVYMELLTDVWSHLYFEKRGKVPELNDPSPALPTHFDGALALDYLRANIDKDFLRSQAEFQEVDQESELSVHLPETWEILHSGYQIKKTKFGRGPKPMCLDETFCPNLAAREEMLRSEAISIPRRFGWNRKDPKLSHEVSRACEALKLLTSTPVETYLESVATRVLSCYPDQVLSTATNHLCKEGILTIASRLHHKKRLPGRSYCYSDKYLSLPDTRILREKLERKFTEFYEKSTSSLDGRLTWSLLANDIETATLLHAISSGIVSLEVDWQLNREKRWNPSVFYRTRKLSDQCIENGVSVIIKGSSLVSPLPSVALPKVTSEQVELVKSVVTDAGTKGITPAQLRQILIEELSLEEIGSAVTNLTNCRPSKVYWTYENGGLILISESYLSDWGQDVNPIRIENHERFIIGRMWYDLRGKIIIEFLKLNLNRIECLIRNFPGISIHTMRRLTGMILNDLELDDILERLIKSNVIVTYPPGSNSIKKNPWIRGFIESHFWVIT